MTNPRPCRLSTSWSALLGALACLAVACDGAGPELDTLQLAVMNGTDYPVITNLSSSEQLAIGYVADAGGEPFCTGTLVTGTAVLTARHCVEGKSTSGLRFGLGHPDQPAAFLKVSTVALAAWETDIALLRLTKSATSAATVKPLDFNRDPLSASFVGESIEAAGYHAISGDSHLRFVVLTVTGVFDTFTKADGFGQKGACQGDSGGPMLVHDGLGQPLVAGTIQGGHISCLQHTYFSRTDMLTEWLDDTLASWAASSGGGGGSNPVGDPGWCRAAGGSVPPGGFVLLLLLLLVLLRRRQEHSMRRPMRSRRSSREPGIV